MARPQEESDLQVPERFDRPWLRSDRPVARKLARPVESFVATEAGSGALLLAAALVALAWSNVSANCVRERGSC